MYGNYDFFTKDTLTNVKAANYEKLFMFFFTLGNLNKQVFIVGPGDRFYKVSMLLNLALSRANPSYLKYKPKYNNKGIVTKGISKLIPLDTRCVISLPGLSPRKVKTLSSKKFYYHLPLSCKSSNLNTLYLNRYTDQSSEDHTALMLSNLYFFYKKGNEDLIKKKIYRLTLLNLS